MIDGQSPIRSRLSLQTFHLPHKSNYLMSGSDLNPYRPSTTPGVIYSPDGLECPYCLHRFPLTFARYLFEPTDTHRCPKCRQKSKLRFSRAHLSYLLKMGVFHGLVGFMLTYAAFVVSGVFACIGVGAGYLLMALEQDRRHDAKRGLVPTKLKVEP